MIDVLNEFKEKISNNEPVIGPFSKTSDPGIIEVIGHAGFDFVIIDMEHGSTNPYQLQNLIRGAETSGVVPIVRVSSLTEISKALDVGACGVEVPQISTVEQAKEAIKLSKFSPEGERGVCRFVRSAKYSALDKFEYFKESNKNILILQIEGEEGISNLDKILEIDGIDIIFIGPYDLSQSLGVAGQIEHKKVKEKINEITKKALSKNIVVGTFCDDIETAKKWYEEGILYLSYLVDMGIFYEACKDKVERFKDFI